MIDRLPAGDVDFHPADRGQGATALPVPNEHQHEHRIQQHALLPSRIHLQSQPIPVLANQLTLLRFADNQGGVGGGGVSTHPNEMNDLAADASKKSGGLGFDPASTGGDKKESVSGASGGPKEIFDLHSPPPLVKGGP